MPLDTKVSRGNVCSVNDSFLSTPYQSCIDNTQGDYCKCPWYYPWVRHTIIRHFFICYPLTCLISCRVKEFKSSCGARKGLGKISAAINMKTKNFFSFSHIVTIISLTSYISNSSRTNSRGHNYDVCLISLPIIKPHKRRQPEPQPKGWEGRRMIYCALESSKVCHCKLQALAAGKYLQRKEINVNHYEA